jgi:hypothetical protein
MKNPRQNYMGISCYLTLHYRSPYLLWLYYRAFSVSNADSKPRVSRPLQVGYLLNHRQIPALTYTSAQDLLIAPEDQYKSCDACPAQFSALICPQCHVTLYITTPR